MPISVTTAEAAVVLMLVAALAGLVMVSSRQRKMLRALAAEPERWQKRLEDLVRLSESTIWTGSPEATNQRMADVLSEALDCDEVYIHLLAVTGDHLTECARPWRSRRAASERYPVIHNDGSHAADDDGSPANNHGFCAPPSR